jgi:hypothetical protein
MKLRELATTETAAFVDRLISAMTAEVDAATERLQAASDAALARVREELAAAVAAGASAEAGRQQSERERDAEASRRAALERALDEARQTIDAVRAEAAAAASRLEAEAQQQIEAATAAAARQRAEAETQLEAARAAAQKQLADAKARIESLTAAAARQQAEAKAQIEGVTAGAARDQAEATAQIEALKASAATRQTAADGQIEALTAKVAALQNEAARKIDEITSTAARQRAEVEAKIATLTTAAAGEQAEAAARLEAARADAERRDGEARERIEQMTAAIAEARKRSEAAAAERDSLSAQLERTEGARAQLARTMREQVLQLASLPMDRLRTGFYRLTTAPSVAEALTALVETLGSEFSRAALFQVTGNRLQGVHQVGFDFESDISKVVVPLTRESPLTEAVRSGRVQGLTANEITASSRTLFGGTPGFVLVLPVAICGEIAAVVYADDSDDPEAEYSTPERRVKFAEVLLWHAVPLLARLSIEETTRAELREYAIQLFTDLERAYAADKSSAPSAEKLRTHLERNLEYAREMFTQQAEAYGRQGSGLFDEQLETLIKSQGSTPFVRDLAAVAHMTVVKTPSKARKHS